MKIIKICGVKNPSASMKGCLVRKNGKQDKFTYQDDITLIRKIDKTHFCFFNSSLEFTINLRISNDD